MMSNINQQSSLAKNSSLYALRNRSNSHSVPIPIPPSLLDKPHLQAMTLPPTSSPYRNIPSSSSSPLFLKDSSISPAYGYGQIVLKEDSWLRDTIPAAYDTGDGQRSPPTRHRGQTTHPTTTNTKG